MCKMLKDLRAAGAWRIGKFYITDYPALAITGIDDAPDTPGVYALSGADWLAHAFPVWPISARRAAPSSSA